LGEKDGKCKRGKDGKERPRSCIDQLFFLDAKMKEGRKWSSWQNHGSSVSHSFFHRMDELEKRKDKGRVGVDVIHTETI